MTVPKFAALKGSGQKITMVTAYDFPFARLVDQSGVEAVLVGDSMSMVVQGHDNTLPVTLDEMIYHAEMVGRAVERALVIVDMPFPSFHLGVYKAIENAGRILKETRCQAVKLEGGVDQAEVIAGRTDTDGKSTGIFDPEASITRAEIAKIITTMLATYTSPTTLRNAADRQK